MYLLGGSWMEEARMRVTLPSFTQWSVPPSPPNSGIPDYHCSMVMVWMDVGIIRGHKKTLTPGSVKRFFVFL